MAICGPVGALATWYAARGGVVSPRWAALLVPAVDPVPGRLPAPGRTGDA
ncbi:hypothetical protein AB0469_36690 [Streptomyces sp. NPDC093801]